MPHFTDVETKAQRDAKCLPALSHRTLTTGSRSSYLACSAVALGREVTVLVRTATWQSCGFIPGLFALEPWPLTLLSCRALVLNSACALEPVGMLGPLLTSRSESPQACICQELPRELHRAAAWSHPTPDDLYLKSFWL